MKISTIIIARNEETNIKDCLETVSWCDEIIVIDDYSVDHSVEIARKCKAKVYQHHLNNDFAAQRNYGLSKVSSEWVFFVDADERVPEELAKEIREVIKNSNYQGFYIKRKDYFGGKALNYGETAKIELLRLGKRKAGLWRRNVHETWDIRGTVGKMSNYLHHYPHQSVGDFLDEVNFYSTLHAKALFKEGNKPNLFRIIINPLGKFVKNYVLNFGFLDGVQGLVVALMMSFHSFLSRGKLYFYSEKN